MVVCEMTVASMNVTNLLVELRSHVRFTPYDGKALTSCH
jgi:hypothetical protein